MSTVLTAFLYSLAPTVAVPLGGLAVSRFPPSAAMRSMLQHFAAGGLIAVIGVELLAELHDGSPWVVAIGIAVGTAFMIGLDTITQRIEQRGGRLAEVGFMAVVAVDFLIDGLLLGVALSHESSLGLLLAIVLTLEDFVTGVSFASSLSKDQPVARLTAAVAVTFPVGAVIGGLLGGVLTEHWYTGLLAFAAVALLFLVIEELLREAHEVAESPWTTGVLFGGLLSFLMLEALI